MPQMSPLWWLSLFIFFSSLFILVNSLNYFFFYPPLSQNNNISPKSNNLNWKW